MPNISEKKCEGCGAQYKLERMDTIFRDKGEIICKCGVELIRWNGAFFYSAERIEDSPRPSSTQRGRRT